MAELQLREDVKPAGGGDDRTGRQFPEVSTGNGATPEVKTLGPTGNGGAAERDELPDVSFGEGREVLCGIASCRPKWLQVFNRVWVFTATYSCVSLFSSLNHSVYSGVVDDIEKEFGISSTTSGLIKNGDNIGYLLCVLIVSHFFRYSNKPRIFCISTFCVGVAIFFFVLPHFFFSKATAIQSSAANHSSNSDIFLCNLNENGPHDDTNRSAGPFRNIGSFDQSSNIPVLVIFFASEFLQGVFASPKFVLSLTYIDDNSKLSNTPKNMAFLFIVRAIGPIIGYSLATWTNSMYVNLNDPGFGSDDPRWIGAWWIGMVICSLLTVAWCLPIVLFPRKILKRDARGRTTATTTATATAQEEREPLRIEERRNQLKDLIPALRRIMTNKLFVLMITASSLEIFTFGAITFLPKYLHFYYGVSMAKSRVSTGMLMAASFSVSPILGGFLTSRWTARPRHVISLILCVSVISNLVAVICFCVATCPSQAWAPSQPSSWVGCNTNCSCSSEFLPVCGSDGLSYYSACAAGCRSSEGEKFSNFADCQCVDEGAMTPAYTLAFEQNEKNTSYSQLASSGKATLGECSSSCNTFAIFITLTALSAFISGILVVPRMTFYLRVVDSKDKSLSLAVCGFFIILILFPASSVYGSIIDSTCLVWQHSTSSFDGADVHGACMYYEQSDLRIRLNALTFAVQGFALIFYLSAWLLSRGDEWKNSGDQSH